MADIEFFNAVSIAGHTWANIAGKPRKMFWRTDITRVSTVGPQFLDLSDWDSAKIKLLQAQLDAAKVLLPKVSKSEYKQLVGYAKSGDRVRDKAERIKSKNRWFS